jgi:hypothetical protein
LCIGIDLGFMHTGVSDFQKHSLELKLLIHGNEHLILSRVK